jgi:hypothetical protein
MDWTQVSIRFISFLHFWCRYFRELPCNEKVSPIIWTFPQITFQQKSQRIYTPNQTISLSFLKEYFANNRKIPTKKQFIISPQIKSQ